MRWYQNSEQLNTVIVCAAAESSEGWQAVALMLQRIAVEGGKGEPVIWSNAAAQAKVMMLGTQLKPFWVH